MPHTPDSLLDTTPNPLPTPMGDRGASIESNGSIEGATEGSVDSSTVGVGAVAPARVFERMATDHPRLTESGRWRHAQDPAPRLVILSGAGLSVESGLSLYRSDQGLWENHDVNMVCNYGTWKNHFELVHQFYNDRRLGGAQALPNAAHLALAQLEAQGAVLLTQNVDILLEAAGAQHVVHLHGRGDAMHCTACGHAWLLDPIRAWDPQTDRCPECNSRRGVKPGVVFFAEPAPLYRILHNVLAGLRAQDVVLTVGTSGEVVPIVALTCRLPCQKWLANLGASDSLPDAFFQHRWYAPITESIDSIVQAWHAHCAAFAQVPSPRR